MVQVLILEDQKEAREALQKIVSEVSGEICVCAAATLREAEELLAREGKFHLFLLDINLKEQDPTDASGMIFAGNVRAIREYAFTPIVMITSVAALEVEAFRQIQCYQYLVKPFQREDVERVVRKVLLHVERPKEESILVKKDGINYRIFCDEILFCKAIRRGVSLYLKKERMDVPYLTIRQLTERLPADQFLQCHRMYIINKKQVEYYDLVNQMIKMNGCAETVEIGVTYKAELRRQLHD